MSGSSMHSSFGRPSLRVAALVLLTGLAHGQLDLPGKRAPRKPDPAEGLLPPPPPHGDVAPRPDGAGSLELPGGPGAGAPATGAEPSPAPASTLAGGDAVAAIFAELARSRDVARSSAAARQLVALGPEGLAGARAELPGEHAPSLLAAARACLAGSGADRAAVAERLTRPLPSEAAVLLDELVASDPVLAAPEYLAGLLDHPSAAMRAAAARVLAPRVTVDALAGLAPLLDSRRSATRAAALELAGRVADPAAWNLVASRLGDPSGEIARRAASLLAAVDAAETMLLERAFPEGAPAAPAAWTRARGYALLGLVEREESRQRIVLGEQHVEQLLAGLASPQPLVAGAAAVALARIGFRASPRATAGTTWLDREVPHQLLRSGTGVEFHADFTSLERPALRALALLSGEDMGADGEAWRRWWVAHAEGFRARRAVIEPGPDAAQELAVRFEEDDGRAWTLVGPARAAAPREREIVLDDAAAARLLARLADEGVLGVTRLPGGTRTGAERELVVALGEQEKRFAFVPGAAPWCDALRAELAELARDNRWQLLFDPARSTAREWWRDEHERWSTMGPLERRRALKDLLLAAARRAGPRERDELVAELALVLGEVGVPEGADLEPLLALLSSEPAYGPRAARVLELARVAAGLETGASPEASPRERLLALALERFGPEADPELARIVRDLGPEVLVHLAADPRPRVRGLVAPGLLDAGLEGEALALLEDPEPAVRLAALAALGEHPVEAARPLLFERARSGPADARAAAMRALARLGGKDVHDLALEHVGEPEPEVQLAAVATLAELARPESASLLASLLVRGPSSPLYADARRGLVRLGAAGVDECLRLARGTGPRARREATLLLAEALTPDAAPLLLTLLSEDPEDERVRWELSVLSGLDLAAEKEPARAGWAWWDLVVHDDPLAWLLAASERAGVPAPPREELVPAEAGAPPALGPVGARFLLSLAELEQPHLVERATRELERRLAMEIERPRTAAAREAFLTELRAAVDARLGR